MKYDTVIFDLDGTLLDTLGDLSVSVNYALEKYGYEQKSEQEIVKHVGYGLAALLRGVFPDGVYDEKPDEILSLYRDHYMVHMNDKTRPYDGVPEILDELRRRGVKTAVVTNKQHTAAVGIVKDYFGDSFTCVEGDGNGYRKKPDPEVVWAVMDKMGSVKERTLYVGDSETDIQTAHNSGLDCLCVTWGFRDKEMLEALSPEYMIDAAEDFFPMLDNE